MTGVTLNAAGLAWLAVLFVLAIWSSWWLGWFAGRQKWVELCDRISTAQKSDRRGFDARHWPSPHG